METIKALLARAGADPTVMVVTPDGQVGSDPATYQAALAACERRVGASSAIEFSPDVANLLGRVADPAAQPVHAYVCPGTTLDATLLGRVVGSAPSGPIELHLL